MSTLSPLVRVALSSVLTIGLGVVANPASAASDGMEQCAGVIKAGKNDCATSRNACHGHVTADADPEAWIYVPSGTCAKIAGARVVKVVDPTPKAKQ
ncbi:MAG: DUF2282 domain-containing protein [Steroidobacteraceae bacterium]|nr:DUF2282 domain-containing protein [Steroidobacteraceae bacterium]